MNVEKTSLPGVLSITPTIHADDRGFFMETWHESVYESLGVEGHFCQDNYSRSCKGTLRGIHYQIENAQGKLVRVVAGEVFDVAVDLRRSSESFGQWVGVHLSAANRQQLWIPPGFGHAFYVVSESAEFEYKCTDYYAPEFGRSIRWDDPDIGIQWPLESETEPVLSTKDADAPLLGDAEVY